MNQGTFHGKPFVVGTLIVILAAAAGLRFYHLGYQSLWVDEIASMNGSDPGRSWKEVVEYSVSDQPPAYFLLLHGWFKVFPYDDWHARVLSVLIGLSGIVAIFFLGKEVKDPETGLIASLISAFSYLHILMSQDARFYTLVFLASTLSFLFFIRAVRESRTGDFILYALTTILVLYTHYFGLVVLAAQGILFCILAAFYRRDGKFIALSVLSGLLVVVAVSPWIPIFFSDAQTTAFWIPREPFYFLVKYFYVYFKDILASFIFAGVLIYYFIHVFKNFRQTGRINPVDVILVGSVSLCFLIPIVYSVIQTPMLNVRYTMILLPCLIVMISIGFSLMKASLRRILLAATCFTSLFSLVVIERYYTKPQKEDWRGLIGTVMQKAAPDDLLVSQKAWYCNYYLRTGKSPLQAILPERLDLSKSTPPGIWWLDAFDAGNATSDTERLLTSRGYRLVRTDSLFRARAFYYRLP